ncbi:MAG: hypothetical protein KDA31_06515 [Phycisphaerales bacterium]|nr:hypothetical protein [Phycisphaerales bacterium]MCB9836142.1 hypothetical protein [Phycisphaera sp.]
MTTHARTSPSTPSAIELGLDPEPTSWANLVTHNTSERATRFREQLGLPIDKPIIMTGHQAQLWHPGILAKLFAAQSVASQVGGVVVWLIVDMDTNEALSLRVPVRHAGGAMTDELFDFTPMDKRAVRRATGATPAAQPAPIRFGPEIKPATPEIAERLERLHRAIAAHADESSIAMQVTRAIFDVLAPVSQSPTIVAPTKFAETDLYQEVLALAADDPGHFAGTFNDAVTNVPDSGVAPVSLGNEELPMWRLDDRGRRERARASDAKRGEALLPGGLLMTGLMRLAGCDLFIHGTGGRSYEPVNDRWLPHLIDAPLAPFAAATATLTLDFDDHQPATQQDADHAAWLAHHARHDPSLVGEDEDERKKRELAAQIESLPRHSRERRALYEQILAILERTRTEHAEEIRRYRNDAERTKMLAMEHRLRTDRTWSVALHSPDRLAKLREAIAARFAE